MLVGIRGKRLAISCGQTEEIAFVVPRRTGKEGPGVILQEFELIVEPACRVVFEKSVDQANQTQNTQTKNGKTYIQLRCYGINSDCLQQHKQLVN